MTYGPSQSFKYNFCLLCDENIIYLKMVLWMYKNSKKETGMLIIPYNYQFSKSVKTIPIIFLTEMKSGYLDKNNLSLELFLTNRFHKWFQNN